ncbi:Ppx/GppA phosphatase family protein [Gammaproteobacteria bacterium AB-CW1]|uniref:Ppx/GppA phosphatase family protein n=2 Tax=Natronospira TaxID=2024969 RepID=A0AAP6MMF4_9GAMM|nr:Ppx/GppA phosphatase family protein [Gammaproteobacteria bacterium AB-CW1]
MGAGVEQVRELWSLARGERLLAAIDLGSNSFHLIVARLSGRDLHVIDRIKETVRLRSGLSEDGDLAPEARTRALACLSRFGERLKGMDSTQVRAVGTDALRRAGDSRDFLEAAEAALGHPIEIISGFEEARLIYAGATPVVTEGDEARLVLDIGGGSTEVILGQGARPKLLESLGMGSVSLTERCFDGGEVSRSNMKRALRIARGEISGVAPAYRRAGWGQALGASGTIRSIAAIAEARGWSESGITLDSLSALCDDLVSRGRPKADDYPELRPDRVPILPGGTAILRAVFEALDIQRMEIAPGALREGLLEDMAGRVRHRDVRDRTVTAMMGRYRMDRAHGRAVARTAVEAWDAVAVPWGLDQRPETREFLRWAACLHEIGMAVSHSQHHRHGAYILGHADMAGFSRDDQSMLSVLARLQRKKLSRRVLDELAHRHRPFGLHLACLLRVAIVLHRARDGVPTLRFAADRPTAWTLTLPDGWLERHPLLADDLAEEVDFEQAAGLRFDLRS